MKTKVIFLCLLIMIVLSSCSSRQDYEVYTKTGFAFDTVVSISLYGCGSDEILDDCFALMADYEMILSPTLEGSELHIINETSRSADSPVRIPVSDTMCDVIKKSVYFCGLTGGKYDITVRPVSELWDFHESASHHVPDSSLIEASLELVDYSRLNLTDNILSFGTTGMMIDLGSVAKGYIADRIKDFLIAKGVNNAVISLGGNILCIGSKPENTGYSIGVETYSDGYNNINTIVNVSDLSVVTSGIYQRCFTVDDTLYHHILDSSTGYPADNGLSSVTIISPSSADADILSTVCFLLGKEGSDALLDSFSNTYAMFVYRDGSTEYTKNFEDFIEK